MNMSKVMLDSKPYFCYSLTGQTSYHKEPHELAAR